MALFVQKYGGSSLSDVSLICSAAKLIANKKKAGNEVVVVVSAMGNTTTNLLNLAYKVSTVPPMRELDMLLTAGERISNSLLAIAVESFGIKACSFTGSQAGIITTNNHGSAKVINILTYPLFNSLNKGYVVLVAGYQGVSRCNPSVTTLGRGGSDTTAITLAAVLNADICEIYTDVNGVFTADPHVVSNSYHTKDVSSAEMLEMAYCGSRILALSCLEYSRKYNVQIHIKSSHSSKTGTIIRNYFKNKPIKNSTFIGVAHNFEEIKVSIIDLPSKPGSISNLFRRLISSGVHINMALQNKSKIGTHKGNITFTCPVSNYPLVIKILISLRKKIGFRHIVYSNHISKVSLVGLNIFSNASIAIKFYKALTESGININLISISKIRISASIKDTELKMAINILHKIFVLNFNKSL